MHSSVNDIIFCAVKSANVPCRLEPSHSLGFLSENQHPDGISLVPWSMGLHLAWDFTCSDTLGPSYLSKTTLEPGAAATLAETRKNTLPSLDPPIPFAQ